MSVVRRLACAAAFVSCLLTPVDAATPLLSPRVVGWESFLRVSWTSGQRAGKPVLSGVVANVAGWGISRIQLLVDELGDGGEVVHQRVVWLGADLTPGARQAFEIPVTAGSARYRVSVFAFESDRKAGW